MSDTILNFENKIKNDRQVSKELTILNETETSQ